MKCEAPCPKIIKNFKTVAAERYTKHKDLQILTLTLTLTLILAL